jgi:hypothetical protein
MFSVSLNLTLADLPSINSLEELEITNAKAVTFPTLAINSQAYHSLQKLTFKNNKLAELEPFVRAINPFRQIKFLSLAQNSLSRLDALNSLQAARHLIELSLERNAIQKLVRLKKFTSLRTLNLNSNRIGQLDDFQFQELGQLTVLDLTHNRLSHLNRNTFSGLKSLKQLLLSHNPFKSFAADTFKHVAGLTRLDLVSNQDADWFTFDNEDVCLLAHFSRCGKTRIHVNSEQTCNCFVKYVGLLTAGSDLDNGNDSLDNCKIENGQYNNLNRFVDDMNRYYLDPDVEAVPPVDDPDKSVVTTNRLQRFRETCGESYLNKCELTGLSATCEVISVNTVKAKTSELHRTGELNNVRTNEMVVKHTEEAAKLRVKVDQSDAALNYEDTAVTRAASSNVVVVDEESSSSLLSDVLLLSKASVESSLVTFMFASLLVVFLLSLSSLVIGIVLLFKRNKYNVYAVASNGYPNDEP